MPVPAPPLDPVQAACDLADRLLRPQAERVDVSGVQRRSLDAIAATGLLGVTAPPELGGGGHPAPVGRQVTEVLAGACGATWFVVTQHALPLATLLASDNAGLRERHLRGMTTGSTLSGVAVAHLRRPGPPAVTATRVAGGWRFDGAVGWATSWGLAEVFLLGGLSPDGEVVLALLPAVSTRGLTASQTLRLMVMQGTRTVRLALDGLVVADEDVATVGQAQAWLEADRHKTANASPHGFGLQAEIARRLAQGGRAATLAGELRAQAEELRARAYALIDDVPADQRVDERLAVRAASLELTVRSATALVAASGGGSMALDAAPQRLAREALFHLVQAQTAPVREATLQVLAR